MSKLTLTQQDNRKWDVKVEQVDLDSSVVEDPDMLAIVSERLGEIGYKACLFYMRRVLCYQFLHFSLCLSVCAWATGHI